MSIVPLSVRPPVTSTVTLPLITRVLPPDNVTPLFSVLPDDVCSWAPPLVVTMPPLIVPLTRFQLPVEALNVKVVPVLLSVPVRFTVPAV